MPSAVNGSPLPFERPPLSLTEYKSSQIKTWPELIEFNSKRNPEHVFCLQADKIQGGRLRQVTFRDLHHAVLNCSRFLKKSVHGLQLPQQHDDGAFRKGRPAAIFADSDLTLLLHLMALVSLGVPALLLSAKLSPDAVASLLKETNAGAVFTNSKLKSAAGAALANAGLELTVQEMVPYSQFLEARHGQPHNPQPLSQPGYDGGETDRNVVILHTSGSTGLPKAIAVGHKYTISFSLPYMDDGFDRFRSMTTLPLYHGYGYVAVGQALAFGVPICLPESGRVMTGSSVIEFLQMSGAKGLFTVPSILEEALDLHDDGKLNVLRTLRFIAVGGAPLKEGARKAALKAGLPVLNHYGSTETGPLGAIMPVGPDVISGFFPLRKDIFYKLDELDQVDKDACKAYRLITRPPSFGEDFTVGDRFEARFKNDLTWLRPLGRSDDLLVLANGEKYNPSGFEEYITQHPQVAAAVVFGEGATEAGVLIKPVDGAHDMKVEDIWDQIRTANERVDRHGRIASKEAVLILDREQDFPTSDKGTVKRRQAYEQFSREIAAAYKDIEGKASPQFASSLHWDSLERDLQQVIQEDIGALQDASNIDADFFEAGMDSLQATQLKRAVISSVPSLGIDKAVLPADFIYQAPSVALLARRLRHLGNRDEAVHEMLSVDKLVSQYRMQEEAIVILTGSTGSLGTHVLQELIRSRSVRRVICLIRKSSADQSATEKQDRALEDKALSLNKDERAKISVQEADLKAPELGLTSDGYDSLKKEATHIVHCAWPMDFKRRLDSFASQFETLQRLLALTRDLYCPSRASKPRLVFVSSIATVGSYTKQHNTSTIPESDVNEDDTVDMGYAKAKLVCERLVADAAKRFADRMDACSVRVGQMSGATTTGYWNPDEHFYALVRSACAVGCLPELQGTHSWVPVDQAARILVDVALSEKETPAIQHLENPRRKPWADVIGFLSKSLDLSIVPFATWLEKTRNFADDEAANPAVKLDAFFERDFEHMSCGGVVLETDKCQALSTTMRELGPVGEADLAKTLEFWRARGLLP